MPLMRTQLDCLASAYRGEKTRLHTNLSGVSLHQSFQVTALARPRANLRILASAMQLSSQASLSTFLCWARTALAHDGSASFAITCRACITPLWAAPLGFSFRLAMAAPQSAQEALQAWLKFLSPEQRREAESKMGAALSASARASDEHTHVDSTAEPAASSGQADPSTTPIPEEPNPILIAQREWYDSQDKIFQGFVPPETPWQDDDLSAQPSSAASAQPTGSENTASQQASDQEPWLLPKPDTCLYNIFGESFQLQNVKESIAKGQMPKCLLYKDLSAADEQPLNRQEMWAATQYKPIFRTGGRWTYYELLPEDIRRPPPQFCDEIEDAPIQPPAARTQPKEKARPKQVPPGGRLGQMSQRKRFHLSPPPQPIPSQPCAQGIV